MSDAPADTRARQHRALATASRRRLLALLQEADDPVPATQLAEVVDLHVTTVRAHLAVLEQAGLVQSAQDRTGRPGRPATVYTAVDERVARPGDDRTGGYHLLAEMLVDGLSRGAPPSDDPSSWAIELGDRWGPRLLDRMGYAPDSDGTAVLHDSFERLGFAPQTTADEVRLHACPFLDVAMGNEAVVCDLHLGMARGMLRALDADVDADEIAPLVEPSLCILSLA